MILVADSGSTKTDWAAIGDSVRHLQSIGLNPLFFTDESLETTISGALADVPAEEVTGVYFYGSGCGLEVNRERLRKCFRSLFPNVRDVEVDTDLVGAAIALYGKEKGIACILGTGANAGIYDGRTIVRTPLSLGYMLGDNGSGAVLGMQLIKLYLRGLLPQDLAAELEREYGVEYKNIIESVYKKERPNKYFASFSPFVVRHKDQEPVRGMLEKEFADFFEYFIVPFFQTEGKMPVRIIGSVGYYYRDVIERVAARYDIRIDKIALKPIDLLIEHHRGE